MFRIESFGQPTIIADKKSPRIVKSGGFTSSENLFQQVAEPTAFRFSRGCKILSYLFNKNGKFCFILLCFFHLTNPLEYPLYQAAASAAHLCKQENSPLSEGI